MPRPRQAVLDMAPYHPPTGGRADKLRLDFNENTVGCSPNVAAALRDAITESGLTVYPEYAVRGEPWVDEISHQRFYFGFGC